MRFRSIAIATLLVAAAPVFSQSAPNPASAPAPRPVASPAVPVPAQPSSPVAAPPPIPPNPAAMPVAPHSDAGATERGLTAGQATGVTPRVRNANAHDADSQGHTLDPHGKPVGQAPAPATTVH